MEVSSVFAAITRCLSILLVAVVLIFQTACSPVQTAPPINAQADKAETSFSTETTSPIVTEIAHSPVQTPLLVTTQADREATSFVIEPVPLTTTIVEPTITPQEVEMPSKGNPKLDSSLNQLLTTYRRGGLAAAQTFAGMHQINLSNDLVKVEMIATEEAVILNLKETVEAVGGEYQGHYQNLLQVLVPIGTLDSLAGQTGVQVIRPPRQPMTP